MGTGITSGNTAGVLAVELSMLLNMGRPARVLHHDTLRLLPE